MAYNSAGPLGQKESISPHTYMYGQHIQSSHSPFVHEIKCILLIQTVYYAKRFIEEAIRLLYEFPNVTKCNEKLVIWRDSRLRTRKR